MKGGEMKKAGRKQGRKEGSKEGRKQGRKEPSREEGQHCQKRAYRKEKSLAAVVATPAPHRHPHHLHCNGRSVLRSLARTPLTSSPLSVSPARCCAALLLLFHTYLCERWSVARDAAQRLEKAPPAQRLLVGEAAPQLLRQKALDRPALQRRLQRQRVSHRDAVERAPVPQPRPLCTAHTRRAALSFAPATATATAPDPAPAPAPALARPCVVPHGTARSARSPLLAAGSPLRAGSCTGQAGRQAGRTARAVCLSVCLCRTVCPSPLPPPPAPNCSSGRAPAFSSCKERRRRRKWISTHGGCRPCDPTVRSATRAPFRRGALGPSLLSRITKPPITSDAGSAGHWSLRKCWEPGTMTLSH